VKEFSSQNWQIELQCPQCGAPLVLEETDRILSCGYCRTSLYLNPEGPSRYYLPLRETPLEEVLFAPYWRFKGMIFALGENGITERLVDTSHLALRSQSFPFSLGIRPQVLKLRFVTSGTGGKFLRSDLPFAGTFVNQQDVQGSRGSPRYGCQPASKAFIGEMVSLIYAPFLIRDGKLFDAILDCPASQPPEEPPEAQPLESDAACTLNFIAMLCPGCGWDLEGQKSALVLFCQNCETAWEASGANFESLDFAFFPSNDDTSFYLPFWRIRAGIPGAGLKSYADLVRLANLPKVIQKAWEEDPPAFWIPAFKIQPQIFLKLARIFTVSRPSQKGRTDIPRAPLHPVTLPLSEAVEGIRVLIASLAVRKDSLPARLLETVITPVECALIYFPFTLKGGELIHPEMPFSISTNALKWGKLL
jgi:hypothetical protein